jgi:hypothetical protein
MRTFSKTMLSVLPSGLEASLGGSLRTQHAPGKRYAISSLSAGPEDVSKFFRHFSDLTFEERSA